MSPWRPHDSTMLRSRNVCGVIAWVFALVPPSVAAMAAVMLVKHDPNTSVTDVVVLSSVAVVFGLFAAAAYRPLLARR